jgi:two-component system, chemotaxis family, protein-glutamate methylesterase/glutaminase
MAIGRDPASLIVIGASAGGVDPLRTIVRSLPADLPAAVAIVLHIGARGRSLLPEILNRAGSLKAFHPEPGVAELLRAGTVVVAPPDHHLCVRGETIIAEHGPRENGHRPSVDSLFRTAAGAWEHARSGSCSRAR